MKKKKVVQRDKWPYQERATPIGAPPKGMWFNPLVKDADEEKKVTLRDALRHFSNHPDSLGKPEHVSMADSTVEFASGQVLSFKEVINRYAQTTQDKFSDKPKGTERGFFDSPIDVGKDPKGDFPSNSWFPKGTEDMSVNIDEGGLGLSKIDKRSSGRGKYKETYHGWVINQRWDGKYMAFYSHSESKPEIFGATLSDVRKQIDEKNMVASLQIKKADSYADAKAWVRTWLTEEDLENDPKIRHILETVDTSTDDVLRGAIAKRVTEILNERGYDSFEVQNVSNVSIEYDNEQIYSLIEKYKERKWEQETDDEYRQLTDRLKTEKDPVKRKQIDQRIEELNNMVYEGFKKDSLTKKASQIDQDSLVLAIENFLKIQDVSYWQNALLEDVLQAFSADYEEHTGKLPSSNIMEHRAKELADLNADWWFDNYREVEIENWLDTLQGFDTTEDLADFYPHIMEYYNKSVPKRAKEDFVSDDQKEEIAAKWGVEYNSALKHYNEALKNGHAKDRAMEYAIDEMKKVDISVSPTKLLEVVTTYL